VLVPRLPPSAIMRLQRAVPIEPWRLPELYRSARELAARAEAGEAAAQATLERWTRRLGRALASVVNVLDPEVVVLGGGLSNLPRVADRARAELEPHVFHDHPQVQVVRNVHGDSSGVRGAAWLWGGPD
jgi:fructokinase